MMKEIIEIILTFLIILVLAATAFMVGVSLVGLVLVFF